MAAFILGGTTKCPKCGSHQFASTTQLGETDVITCAKCLHTCTIKEAKDAARAKPKAGGSENFIDE